MARDLMDLGCDSLCIKDMAALLKPQPAYDIVKAIEAGADVVDTSISSLSLGPGHNPTESLVEMLRGTPYSTNLDDEKLLSIKDHFAKVRPRYTQFMSAITGVETEIFKSQIPGGMISNMESQLRQQGAGDRLRDVLLEVPKVRAVAGYPPLVTPSSQIVGTQAVFNVLMGPYKVLTAEFADLMLGYYGATLGERDLEIVEASRAQTGKEPIDVRPADLIPPEWDRLVSEATVLEGCDGTDEDVLTYAMFPGVAPGFFTQRADGPKNVGKDPVEVAAEELSKSSGGPVRGPIHYSVDLGGRKHSVTVERA